MKSAPNQKFRRWHCRLPAMIFLSLAACIFGAGGVLMLRVDPPYGYLLSAIAALVTLQAFWRTDYFLDSQYLSSASGWLWVNFFRRRVRLSEIRALRMERRNVSSRKHASFDFLAVLTGSDSKEVLLDSGIAHLRRIAPLRAALMARGMKISRWRDDE